MDASFTVTGADQLRAIADPMRWRILGALLDAPASIQEIARALGAPKGTVGHHVHVLDEAGLIRVVETKRVRGVVEKRYARVARHFRLPEADAARDMGPEAATVSLLPLRQALAEARASSGPNDPSTAVVVRARMSAERAHRFGELMHLLAAEFADGAPDAGETFGLVAAIYVPEWSAAGGRG